MRCVEFHFAVEQAKRQCHLNNFWPSINLDYVQLYDQTCEDAFGLFRRCISSGVVDFLQKQAQMKIRQSIYTAQVVIWLMMLQATATEGDVGNWCRGAADGRGRWLAERM